MKFLKLNKLNEDFFDDVYYYKKNGYKSKVAMKKINIINDTINKIAMKRYNTINEDFFDSVNDEDNEELTKEDIRASYENTLIIAHYIPFNKKTFGRKIIDIIPLVKIIKQFFSIIETLRFVGEYNVKLFFVGVDLLKLNTHKKEELIIEIDNDRITEKDYLKNICYKLCNIYDRIEEFNGTMNISLTIHMTFEAVPVPSMTFFNDFRKLESYCRSVSKLGCLSDLSSGRASNMIFYNGGMTWRCRVGFLSKLKPSGIWDLATKIFGTDNKYYNIEEKNKLFSTDKSNSKYHLLLQSLCPNFLKKMALYFKRKREHCLCDIIGYDYDYTGHLYVVVYLDNKDYDNITVKNIVDYMKELFDKFNIYDYSELKAIGHVLHIYVSCYKLPEKKLGEKFFINLLEQHDFLVNMRIVDDNDSNEIIKNDINSAITKFKKFKDEISKIK